MPPVISWLIIAGLFAANIAIYVSWGAPNKEALELLVPRAMGFTVGVLGLSLIPWAIAWATAQGNRPKPKVLSFIAIGGTLIDAFLLSGKYNLYEKVDRIENIELTHSYKPNNCKFTVALPGKPLETTISIDGGQSFVRAEYVYGRQQLSIECVPVALQRPIEQVRNLIQEYYELSGVTNANIVRSEAQEYALWDAQAREHVDSIVRRVSYRTFYSEGYLMVLKTVGPDEETYYQYEKRFFESVQKLD